MTVKIYQIQIVLVNKYKNANYSVTYSILSRKNTVSSDAIFDLNTQKQNKKLTKIRKTKELINYRHN